ncbi:MAG: hypothetical protein JJ992_12695, partial [Planctomycetes bacterium]|nr:hypothetical protein [Planctomycetota bacterium]
MLHAFDADDGTELFAYVPEAAYDGLADLSDPNYGEIPAKNAFVDGGIQVTDVKLNGDEGWRTVLVGALGLGGQGIYALDVSDPVSIKEDDPSALALWEFTDASGSDAGLDGRDLGITFAPPALVRIDDDIADDTDPVWVALLANGYNNTSEAGE